MVRGMEPVLFWRSFRTASALPQRIGQFGDFAVPKDRDAVLIHSVPVQLLATLVSLLGMLKSLPGALLPGFVILLLMGFRGTTMSVCGIVVQLSGPLLIFVMRSVAIACRH